MLSGVLNSQKAIKVNIAIMRVFVRIREAFAAHKELARKLEELERQIGKHDSQIETLFDAIRRLMAPPDVPSLGKPKPEISFKPPRNQRRAA